MKILSKDIIALIVLSYCFYLLSRGVNSFVTAITTMIIGYYFSKRVFEEKNGNTKRK